MPKMAASYCAISFLNTPKSSYAISNISAAFLYNLIDSAYAPFLNSTWAFSFATSTFYLILSNFGCNLCFFSLLTAADYGLAGGVVAAEEFLLTGDSAPICSPSSFKAPSTLLLASFNLFSWLESSDFFFSRASAASFALFSFSAASAMSLFCASFSSSICRLISAALSFDSLSFLFFASSRSASYFLTWSALRRPSCALSRPAALVNLS